MLRTGGGVPNISRVQEFTSQPDDLVQERYKRAPEKKIHCSSHHTGKMINDPPGAIDELET